MKLIKKNTKINLSFPKQELRSAVSKPSYTYKTQKNNFFSQTKEVF